MSVNVSNQMLEKETMKPVDKQFKCNSAALYGDLVYLNDLESHRKLSIKDIAFEIAIYVTRKNLRGGLKYVR